MGLKAIRNLDYVILLCADVNRMKQFYHEELGFPLYRDWGEWVEMQVGATLLGLRRRGRSPIGFSLSPLARWTRVILNCAIKGGNPGRAP